MSGFARIQTVVGLGMVCCQILLGDETFHFHRHRKPLGLPVSAPFSLAQAVDLPEWPQVCRITELLQTDRGSLELLRELPLVEAKFADASYFLELIQKWRDRIPVLSERPDSLTASDSSWVVLDKGRTRSVTITFRHEVPENSLTILKFSWVDGVISDVSFARGFTNVLPMRERHRRRDSGRGRAWSEIDTLR